MTTLRRLEYLFVAITLLVCTASAQRTADFRRLSLENGNAAQKSWLISDQSSLGIDANGTLTGTFPNTNAMLTLGAGVKTTTLDLQSMLGGTGILFSENVPATGIDMSLGASGTGIVIDGGTPLGMSIGLVSAGSDGITVDATNSGISVGNGTAPNNGMNIEATSTGLSIGAATTPDIGQTTDANITGGTFDAGIIGVDIGQVNSPTLGLGVQSVGTGIDVADGGFFGTGINVTMNNFVGTGINIQDNTVSGTGLNVNSHAGSIGVQINGNGSTDNVLVVNGTADATLLSVGGDPVWDARVNGDLHVSGIIKMGGSIYIDGTTPNNHSILANDDLTIGTNAPGQNFNLVAGPGGMINITAPIMFPPLPSLSNLDMGSFLVLNIGNPGTDFTAGGGLTLADKLTIGNIPTLSSSLNVLVTNGGIVEQRTAASIIAATAWALGGNTAPSSNIFGTLSATNVLMQANGTTQLTLRNTGGIELPVTTAGGVGVVFQNGTRFLHSFGITNTFLGADAGNFTLTGNANTGIGRFALSANSNGFANTAVGEASLASNTLGAANTAIGQQALRANTTSSGNTAVGRQSLLNSTGSSNTALGENAGLTNITGSSNTFIGGSANPSVNNLSNATAIGAGAVVSQNDALILGNNAQVGIKNSAPTADLDVNGTVRIRNLSTVYTNLVTANASGNLGNNTAIGLGLVTGTGTTNTIPKWTTSTGALGNSLLSDNATSLTYTGSNVTLNASGANALIQSGPRNSGDGLSSTFTIQARTVVYGANFATDGTNLALNGGGGISDGTFGLARKGDVILTPGWNNYFPGADNRAAQNGSVVFNVGNNSPEVFRCSNVKGAGGAVATFAFNGATVAAGNTFQVGTGGSNGNGASLTTGGTWTNGSSRNFKERFTSLDGSDVLSKISGLNVLGWYYKGTNEYHIGPIAEEFYAAFNTGNQANPSQTEKYISSVDPAGVALVGIKELVKQNEEQAARIKALEEKLERLEKLLVK